MSDYGAYGQYGKYGYQKQNEDRYGYTDEEGRQFDKTMDYNYKALYTEENINTANNQNKLDQISTQSEADLKLADKQVKNTNYDLDDVHACNGSLDVAVHQHSS